MWLDPCAFLAYLLLLHVDYRGVPVIHGLGFFLTGREVGFVWVSYAGSAHVHSGGENHIADARS